MYSVNRSLFRPTLFSSFLLGLVTAFAPGSVLGQPSESLIHRIAPADCFMFASWAGFGQLDPAANPTEKWLAQKEIQHSLSQLYAAIKGYQESNPIEDKFLNELLSKAPEILKDCPASVYFGSFDPKIDFLRNSPHGCAIIQLKHHEAWVKGMLNELIEKMPDADFQSLEIEGNTFFTSEIGGDDNERIHVGVANGHLIATIGVDAISKAMSDLKTPEPKWMTDALKEVGTKRRLGFFHLNPSSILELSKRSAKGPEIPEFLHLEEIQSVSGVIGLDEQGLVSSWFIQCPEKTTGILSVLSQETIDESLIDEMPGDAMSSSGIRLSFSRILEMIRLGSQAAGVPFVEDALDEIEGFTNMEVDTEIIDSFDGLIWQYSNLSPLTMGTMWTVSLKVKDPAVFAERLAKFNKEISGEIRALELGEFIEKQSKGQTIYSFKPPAYGGPGFSWCHVEDQLYISVDANALGRHLRKRGRTKGRLIDDQRFKNMFEYGEAREWGKPIGFSRVDIATVAKFSVPLLQTFLAGQSLPGFDFTVDDIPSVDVLINGVEANVIGVFRSKRGVHLVERSTLPGLSSIATSGVAVGMLLPAVQQVREAARRTTAMNNMRQLQLSILNYEQANDKLPPAYSANPAGEPMLSWRVHILPYLEEQALYDQFRLDEPWDSPHNKPLIKKMPMIFENPSAITEEGHTTFLGVAGKQGVFIPSGLKISQVSDGTSLTISIVDVRGEKGVPWTAPQDFDPSKVDDILSVTKGNHPGVDALVVFVDCSSRSYSGYSSDELRGMMTRGGREDIDKDR